MKHVYGKHMSCETSWNGVKFRTGMKIVSTKWFAINAIDCLWLQWRNLLFFADACGCPLRVCWFLQCCQGLCFQRLRISQEPAMSRTQVTETYRHEKCRKVIVFLQRLVERSWCSDMLRMFRQLNHVESVWTDGWCQMWWTPKKQVLESSAACGRGCTEDMFSIFPHSPPLVLQRWTMMI